MIVVHDVRLRAQDIEACLAVLPPSKRYSLPAQDADAWALQAAVVHTGCQATVEDDRGVRILSIPPQALPQIVALCPYMHKGGRIIDGETVYRACPNTPETFGFGGSRPRPPLPEALELQNLLTAMEALQSANQHLDQASHNVPDYTGQWGPDDYTAQAQEEKNRCVDGFFQAFVQAVRFINNA